MIKKLHLLLIFVMALSLANAQSGKRIQLNKGKEKSDIKENVQDYKNKLILKESLSFINVSEKETKQGSYIQLEGKGMVKTYRAGQPDLPVFSRLIEVPLNHKAEVRVISFDEEIIELSMENINQQIIPAQPSLSKSDDPEKVRFYKDKQIYNTNDFYKRDILYLENRGILRDKQIAYLEVSPFEYNPVTNTIKVLNNLEIEVNFVEDKSAKAIPLRNTKSPYYNNLINTVNKVDDAKSLIEGPVKYVIVSDRMFEETLQPFVLWKTQKGFNVIVAYTDQIGSTKEEIKAYLQDLYENPSDGVSPTFILFVGDVAQIPAFDTQLSGDYHVTDLYYCEYTGDKLPEVFYGRFSATSVEQLQPQIDKTLMLEKYTISDPSYLDNVILVAGVDAGAAPTYGNGFVNYANDYYTNSENGINSYYYLYNDASGVMSSNNSEASASIRSYFNAGVSVANYTAHCGPSGWSDPSFSISHIPALTNENMYPLVIGNCCQSVKFEGNSFGEEIVRASGKGAVAYIGGSDYTYWDEDYYWGVGLASVSANPTYEGSGLGSYDRFFHLNGESKEDWYITQGQMLVAGNLAVEESSSTRKAYYWEIYHLMGDPSLTPYVTVPEVLTASYNSELIIGSTSLQVTTEQDAYVALSKDGVLLDAKLVGSSGLVELNFETINDATPLDLVITKQNRQPVIDEIIAIPATSPYITLNEFSINDATENNNGYADFAETISLNISLKNISDAYNAYDVNAILNTNDTNVVINDNAQSFGNIAYLDDSLINQAFEISLKNKFNDQQIISFELSLTGKDDQNKTYTWKSEFNIKVNAPKLEIGEILISENSGNANDTIDPGEMATMRLIIKNNGSADIEGLKASAFLLGNTSSILTLDISEETGIVLKSNTTDTIDFIITADVAAEIGSLAYIGFKLEDISYDSYSVTKDNDLVIGNIPVILISQENTVNTRYAYFYDSGGKDGKYANGEDYTITLISEDIDKFLQVEFLSFAIEPNGSGCYDILQVYNGNSTSAPLLGTYCSSNVPQTLRSDNTENALTFLFNSDGSVTESGWEAIVRSVKGYNYQLTVNGSEGPIEGAIVTFNNNIVTTGPDGIALFENISEGLDVSLLVEAPGYMDFESNVDLLQNVSEEVYLNRSFSDIKFIVKDKLTGNFIENAKIIFVEQTAYTNANGEYTFLQVPYLLKQQYVVSKDNYSNHIDTTDIINNKTINVLMEYPESEVLFSVIDSESHPITGANIIFNNEQGVTNSNGELLFSNVPSKINLDYQIIKSGYDTINENIIINRDDTVEVVMNFIGYDVVFTIKNGSSKINNAVISFNSEQKTSDVDGIAIFNHVFPASNIALLISKDGYNTLDTAITVIDQNKYVDLQLSLATALPDIINSNFKIYPNPSEGIFNIEINPYDNSQYKVLVYDILGSLVYQKDVNSNSKHQVNISNYAKGLYFLSVEGEGQKISKRLIIK